MGLPSTVIFSHDVFIKILRVRGPRVDPSISTNEAMVSMARCAAPIISVVGKMMLD
jgi:hypothetical protein